MTVEERLRKVEDVQAIVSLMSRYANFADSNAEKKHSGAEVPELFAEDGSWHIVPTGGPPLVGHPALTAHFDDASLFPFSYHLLGNPLIEVDGDEASGRWHVTVLFNARDIGPMWVFGYYDNRFVRTPAGWRIASLRCTAGAAGPFGEAW